MSEKLKILHLEDEVNDVELVRTVLDEQGYEYELDNVDTRDEFISALNECRYDLVLSDYSLPTYDGLSALQDYLQKCPDVPFIMFSGTLGEERAVEVLNSGATDYVAKEHFERLGPAISRSLEEASERMKRREAEQKLQQTYERFYHLVNSAPSVIYSTTYGTKHVCTFVSDNFLQVFGYPPYKMIDDPKFWLSCIHPDDRMKVTELIEQQLQEKGTGLMEYRFMSSNGEYYWLRDSFSVVYDLKNNPSEIVGSWTDITTYKEAVEETKRLTTAINVTDDPIFITDTNATILYINPAFSQLTGYSYEDAIGNNPRILNSGHQSKEFYQNLWDTIKSGDVFKATFVNRTKAGDEFYSEQTITPICDESGTIIEFISVMRDITERKRGEEELEKLLHDQGERVKEIQCMYGVADSIQNRTSLEEIFQDVARLIPPSWHYPEITRGKVTFDGEEYVSEPFEETEWTQSSDIIVHGEPRGSIAVYYLEECPELDEGPFMTEERNLINGMSRTISEAIERRQAEEALRESDERFRASFADATIGMTLVSLGHSIIEANQAFSNMLGYSKEELVGIFFKDITHPDDMDTCHDHHHKLIAGEINNYRFEKRYLHKQGHEIWALLSASLVRDNDAAPLYVIAQIQDITERKQAEEQLRRSQKMEAIGQLAGGIAHDFNNLLGIFQSNFELLQDFNIKDDNFQKWTNSGLKTVQRGASLTRRLLSFSRVDAVGTETVNINESIAELKDLLAKSLTPKITVELNLGEEVWQVNIDTDEFQDALVNLALNARDTMPDGGTLSITTSNKVMGEEDIKIYPGLEVGNYVMVSVSDTGCGMDKETLGKVFEPFFTTKEKEKGTGLGLSMVYGFAKRSRGYVKIYSEVGHGTTVRLYLPMIDMREEEREENNAGAKAIPGGTEMILAVDDEIELLQGIKHRLESLGYQVLTAGNGPEALEVINSHQGQIALLFSDVVMPGEMSGYALAQEVEKREPGIKILLASGFTNSIANKTDTLNSHFEVMEKPYTKMELATKVRDVLDSG